MKKLKAILFDLDGTLLPLDQNEFMRSYFGRLAATLAPRGYEPKSLIDAVWAGTAAMVKNDGSVTNEDAFWQRFSAVLGERVLKEKDTLENFYLTDFENVRESCGFDPDAALTVRKLRERGYLTVLATNPIFPAVATRARMRWAGLTEDDFLFFTSYENSSFAKPNLDYYREIMKKLGVAPEECMMVGNDVGEDMIAEELGMRVFLVDRCLLNKEGRDVSRYAKGSFTDLSELIDKIEN